MPLSMEQARQLGEEIARMFELKESERKSGQFETTWGRKTHLGIGLCVERVLNEITNSVDIRIE